MHRVSDIFDQLAAKYGSAVVITCEENQCKLVLLGLPNHIALKGESLRDIRYGKGSVKIKIADRLLFSDGKRLNVCAIELKSSDKDRAFEQIKNAVSLSIKILDELGLKTSMLSPYAFIVSNRWKRISEKMAFQQSFWVEGLRIDTVCLNSGERLSDYLIS